MRKDWLILLILILFCPTVFADDTVEAAVTGNIVFEKTPELVMQDETLTISQSAGNSLEDEKVSIEVDFHFKNISNHDITRKMAFVLPPVQCRMEVNSLWRGLDTDEKDEPHNQGLKDFLTTVNGQSQSFTTRSEAILHQHIITDLLNQLHIPLNPCNIRSTAEGKPDPRYSEDLKKYHLLTQTNEAAWSQHIYFEWLQTFPAGKTIQVKHRYTPVIGESVLSPRSIEDLNALFPKVTPDKHPIWNQTPSTLSQSHPRIMENKKDQVMNESQTRFCVMPKWVQYHLKTGANWNGGIGTFKLIIRNAANTPFAVNQFYKNDSPIAIAKEAKMMSFTITHFIPTENLFVLFLSLPHSAEEFKACGI